jgi:sphingomyelin phosphodiesterase 2
MAFNETEINILTLNCWGLGMGISKDRNERMEDIGKYISAQNYDVVLLQEVWKHENYYSIRSLVSSVLPHSYYFDSGIIGTGTCIFSKVRINDVAFHHFGLNGYPHKLMHGDWFGGKGLGLGQIDFKGFNIHIFTSHYHATYNYNPIEDVYLGHRVVHGVESAQWIKLSSSSADLTIYAGDFNTEPKDIPYQIVRYVTPLCDAWVEANGCDGGETSETPSNSYTQRSSLKESPTGKRIDYIMYMSGPNIHAETISCELPLPDRVPGKNLSYSDHEAIAAKIFLRRKDSKVMTTRDFVRSQSCKEIDMKRNVVGHAKDILENSLRNSSSMKMIYICILLICLLLLFISFIPVPHAIIVFPGGATLMDIFIFIIRLILIVVMCYLGLMASLFLKRERHALRSTLSTLDCILENHHTPDTSSHPSIDASTEASSGGIQNYSKVGPLPPIGGSLSSNSPSGAASNHSILTVEENVHQD